MILDQSSGHKIVEGWVTMALVWAIGEDFILLDSVDLNTHY
jgi:hypothetical protein